MNTNKPQFFSSIHSCPFVSIRGSISVLALYLLLASSFLCLGANSSEHLFLWNEANAIMTSATTPEDYLTAAQAYQNLIDAGICNGPICYNMGTALLHAGRYNSAIDALLRAEQYIGNSPDILQNMKIAIARKSKGKGLDLPWYRIVLFLHFRLSSPTRMLITASAFSVFWIVLALRTLGIQRGFKSLAILTLLAFVLFGSSVATSLHEEVNAKRFSLMTPEPKKSS